MKNIIISFILLISFGSCKSDKEKKNEKFVAKIESADINSLLNIEFVINGETETYNYYKADTLFSSWEYNNLTKQFENYDTLKVRIISSPALNYMEDLRTKVKSLNVSLISQTQWHSEVIKFWIGDAEYFTYVHPDFKFDTNDKTLLKNELLNSDKINDYWFYRKMKVCRNK